MTFITTRDGTRLFAKSWGAGRPVILIHGWPLHADSFDVFSEALAGAGFRAISYDRRGFGRSDQPDAGYDYDTLADDLADVMAAMEVEGDAALVGFSMGGGEVARYLARHGSAKVRAAALLASVVPFVLKTEDNPDGAPKAVFDGMIKGITKDRPGFFRDFFDTFYGQGTLRKAVSQGQLDQSFQHAMMAGLRPTLASVRAFSTTDFRPDLAAFTMPTLIVHGTKDQNVPIDPSSRAAAKAIPGAKLVEYDGDAHGILVTRQDELIAELIAFLR